MILIQSWERTQKWDWKLRDVASFNELIAGEAIFEIGRRLKHVKENDLAHGEWSKWCESIGIDRSNANKYIRVYDEFSVGNVVTSPHLGLDALYQIALMPPEQRDQPHTIPSTGEVKSVHVVVFKGV